MKSGKTLLNEVHGAIVLERRVRILAKLIALEMLDPARVLDVGTGDEAIAAEIGRLRPDVAITGAAPRSVREPPSASTTRPGW